MSAKQVAARRTVAAGRGSGLRALVSAVRDGCMEDTIRTALDKAGFPTARRHLFVCIGPDCCETAQGEALWEHIKRRVREHGLPVMRTKAACLRVCRGGPWLVVYPEGTWYGGIDAPKFDRILHDHLIGGSPVAGWVAARNGLDGCGGCVS